jgi:rare lipoprotein A
VAGQYRPCAHKCAAPIGKRERSSREPVDAGRGLSGVEEAMWLPIASVILPIGLLSAWSVTWDVDRLLARVTFQERFQFDRSSNGTEFALPSAGLLGASQSLLAPEPLAPPAMFSHGDVLVPPMADDRGRDVFERMLTDRVISTKGIKPSNPPSPTPAEFSPVPALALQPGRRAFTGTEPASSDRPVGRPVGAGRAAWYEHPGRTASGETFDPERLTAAHRTLPFGKTLRVVNLRNGRSVLVRINDRTPPKIKFVIDLSRRSAREIGLKDVGPVALYEAE